MPFFSYTPWDIPNFIRTFSFQGAQTLRKPVVPTLSPPESVPAGNGVGSPVASRLRRCSPEGLTSHPFEDIAYKACMSHVLLPDLIPIGKNIEGPCKPPAICGKQSAVPRCCTSSSSSPPPPANERIVSRKSSAVGGRLAVPWLRIRPAERRVGQMQKLEGHVMVCHLRRS